MVDPVISIYGDPELFMVRNELVASQNRHQLPYCKENHYEIINFYCVCCGTVWGKRIAPEARAPLHQYWKRTCSDCGGTESLLTGMEERNLDLLSLSVLAYEFLTLTEDRKDVKT